MADGPCVGCGAAGPHPWSAIMKGRDVETQGDAVAPAADEWVAMPVCPQCWADPDHRTHPIKAHFCAARDEEKFVSMAGSSTLGQ